MKQYFVEIRFTGNWTKISEGYESRGKAEWALALWRQGNQCLSDEDFRVVEVG